MKTKQNSFLIAAVCSLALTGILVLLPPKALALEPGSVKLDPDFGQKAMDYVLTKPIISGPFTGEKDADLEEIYPFFADPVNKFTLTLGASSKQQFRVGDTASAEGEISFAIDSAKAKEIVKSSENCSNCPSANIYRFPELNDMGIFVQVFRKDEDKIQSLKGDYLVDEFYAAQGLSLSESKKENIKVIWKIPAEIKEGKYYFSLTVNANQRFSLAGTPLLAQFPAKIFDFQVNNPDERNGAEIDKNNLAINDKTYVSRSPAPTVDPQNGAIKVTIPVANLNQEAANVNIKYQLYRWGQEDKADLISSKDEIKNIGSTEKANLEYSFNPDDLNSVYNLKVIATTSQSVSTANIRFVVRDHNRGVFDFLGKAQNDQGVEYPTFCLRDSQWTGYFQGKLTLSAFDSQGKNLFKVDKDGEIEAVTRCFVLKGDQYKLNDSNTVSIKGEIYTKGGQLVDQKIVNLVSPKKIVPTNVTKSLSAQNFSNLVFANKLSVLIIVIIILAGLLGYYYYFMKNKLKQND